MPIDPKDAFLHVIYDHRYLALAAAGWCKYGPAGSSEAQREAKRFLPGISTPLLESLLMHGRSLIDFYTAVPSSRTPRTDILLRDFDGIAIDPQLSTKLRDFKKPVEVHLLHLTSWRDTAFRNAQGRSDHNRPTWDTEATTLVGLILDALQDVANRATTSGSKWEQPFTELHTATSCLFRLSTHPWPKQLAEKSDVTAYLMSFGL
ncbi:hypothetical protein [Nocardia abscessus]|uniref:hypothetical protein n=1 Tax=Nocardia abscessus TaxID=120957 RepID=UPI002456F1F6|nr:hypothetical protein [Nocardia abscessus]